MQVKNILLGASLAGIVAVAVVGGLASAHYGGAGGIPLDKPVFTAEKKQAILEYKTAIQEAIEQGDYEAWQALVEGKRIAEIIDSEDDFIKLMEMYNLMAQVKEIKEELGLEKSMGTHKAKWMYSKGFHLQK